MKKLKTWRLKSQEERRFKTGHPWVYSNELQESPKGIDAGDLIELTDSGGQFLAYGIGNPNSLIAFRALTRKKKETEEFSFEVQVIESMREAFRFRLSWFNRNQSYRCVYGEADTLPGLVIDRYAKSSQKSQAQTVVYVVQPHSFGMDRNLEGVLQALQVCSKEIEDPAETFVVLRRDASSREREGLKRETTEVKELKNLVTIPNTDFLQEFEFTVPSKSKIGITFQANLISGQKTGFFFDQLQNIHLLQSLIHQRTQAAFPFNTKSPSEKFKILDLCTYVGQWSVHLLETFSENKLLPLEVTAVDASETSLVLAEKNVTQYLNQLKLTNLIKEENSFRRVKGDVLDSLSLENSAYHVVIADPPALIKSRKDIPQGKAAYAKLFSNAIQKTAPGGLVVCCSCSQLLSLDDFMDSLSKASRRSDRKVRWISQGSPSMDHFNRFDFREGHYLKCWIGQVD